MLDRQIWEGANFDNSAIRLTNLILGFDGEELSETLKTIALEIGIRHIAYLRFAPEKSYDPSSRTTIATYPKEWQTDYFLKGYEHFDPVVAQGRNALLPFDWETLARDDPRVLAFLADAAKHGVGRNGLSIPVRNRRGERPLVSFTSDHSRTEWARYKRTNMPGLQNLSSLIDEAADAHAKLPLPPVMLSRREEECLIWAASGKTAQEIAELMDLGFSLVKAHLDTARHKLHCMNLEHAVAVATATGVIPVNCIH